MRVKTIKVRRNASKGNYVHKHVEVEVEVMGGDDVDEAFEYADFLVAKQLGEINESEFRKYKKFAKFLAGNGS